MLRGTRRIALAALTLTGLLLGGASLAWACTAQAYITLSTRSGEAGSRITVTGERFAPGPVEIRWDSPSGPVIGEARGPSFSVRVQTPSNAAPDVYHITAVGYTAAGSAVAGKASAPFEVLADSGDRSSGDRTSSGGEDGQDSTAGTTSQDTSGATTEDQEEEETSDSSTSGTTSGATSGSTSGSTGQEPEQRPAADQSASETATGDERSSRTDVTTPSSEGGPAADGTPAEPSGTQPAVAGGGEATGGSAGDTQAGTAAAAHGTQSTSMTPSAADARGSEAPGHDGPARETPTLAEPVSADAPPSGDRASLSAARSASGDLWSGFIGEGGHPGLVPGLGSTGAASTGTGGPVPAGGLLLMLVGLGTMAAGLTVAGARRRVRVQEGSADRTR